MLLSRIYIDLMAALGRWREHFASPLQNVWGLMMSHPEASSRSLTRRALIDDLEPSYKSFQADTCRDGLGTTVPLQKANVMIYT